MVVAFSDELRRRRNNGATAFWTLRRDSDTVSAAGRERLDAYDGSRPQRADCSSRQSPATPLLWPIACFYHPYFEGVAIRAPPYGLALGLVLGASIATAVRCSSPPPSAAHASGCSRAPLPSRCRPLLQRRIDRAVTGVFADRERPLQSPWTCSCSVSHGQGRVGSCHAVHGNGGISHRRPRAVDDCHAHGAAMLIIAATSPR